MRKELFVQNSSFFDQTGKFMKRLESLQKERPAGELPVFQGEYK